MKDLDPEQEERLRALLSEGSAGPMPAEVTARLDDTLAGLVAEREAEQVSEERFATGTVVPLRPRWMPRIAAGAAAVIVLGLGGVTVAANLAGSGSSETASDAGAGTALKEETTSEPPPVESAPNQDNSLGDRKALSDGLPQVRSATFERDVQRILGFNSAQRQQESANADDSCPGPQLTDGSRTRPISLDGEAAVLVLRPRAGGTQPVEAWSCDGTRRLARATVTP